MKKLFLSTLLIVIAASVFAQKVIPLYNGQKPSGSERLTTAEKVVRNASGDITMVSSVSMPTLTLYAPLPGQSNGTSVIVCPGGAFRFLSFASEGIDVAKWLNSKGITAFILKYRLVPESPGINDSLMSDLMKSYFKRLDSVNEPYIPLAVADGLEAVKYVRQHCGEFGLDPKKIGIMGFSAGGTVTGSVARTYDSNSRPDFAAPIYAYCPAMLGKKVQADAPPMFLVIASDDPIAYANTRLYEMWRDAGKSVEMHAFYKGGHGFGIQKRNTPVDNWKDLFSDWMVNIGMLSGKK
jgi:acetyl esterase/lipase